VNSNLQLLLKESWALVEDRQDRVAGWFYAYVFTHAPGVRDLFPVHMDVQRSRLLTAIVTAVHSLDDPLRLDDYLRGLGRDHRKFGAEADHYTLVGEALVASLREHAGQRWSYQYEQAWQDAYGVIAEKMIAGAAADPNPAFWYAEVVAHERRARDIAVLTVVPFNPPVPYLPGQYVSVETTIRPRLWRTYSIANAPRPDHSLDLHVRALSGGWVSGALVRRTKVGQMLRIAAPMGSMVLDPASERDIVCVVGGTGLAPIKAMIEELAEHNRTRQVCLIFGARRQEDLYDLPALDELAKRCPWLTVVPALSGKRGRGAATEVAGELAESGTAAEVMQRRGPWDNHDFYVSGSSAMVTTTLRTIAAMKVPSTRVRFDTFGDG
jgi:NAD(P)H-flavin reductase